MNIYKIKQIKKEKPIKMWKLVYGTYTGPFYGRLHEVNVKHDVWLVAKNQGLNDGQVGWCGHETKEQVIQMKDKTWEFLKVDFSVYRDQIKMIEVEVAGEVCYGDIAKETCGAGIPCMKAEFVRFVSPPKAAKKKVGRPKKDF